MRLDGLDHRMPAARPQRSPRKATSPSPRRAVSPSPSKAPRAVRARSPRAKVKQPKFDVAEEPTVLLSPGRATYDVATRAAYEKVLHTVTRQPKNIGPAILLAVLVLLAALCFPSAPEGPVGSVPMPRARRFTAAKEFFKGRAVGAVSWAKHEFNEIKNEFKTRLPA